MTRSMTQRAKSVREQFEAWAIRSYHWNDSMCKRYLDRENGRPDAPYWDDDTELLYRAYRAGHASALRSRGRRK